MPRLSQALVAKREEYAIKLLNEGKDLNYIQIQLTATSLGGCKMSPPRLQELQKEMGEKAAPPVGFFCLTAAPLTANEPVPEIPDLLRRIDALLAAGGDVVLFRQRELYQMKALVNRYTQEPVRFVAGLSLIIRALDDVYGNLEGGPLEALGRLFAQNVRIYAYPMTSTDLRETLKGIPSASSWEWSETNGMVSATQLRHAPPLGHLFDYLLASNFLVPIQAPASLKAGG